MWVSLERRNVLTQIPATQFSGPKIGAAMFMTYIQPQFHSRFLIVTSTFIPSPNYCFSHFTERANEEKGKK